MSFWEASLRAGLTTLVVIVILSIYERRPILFPVVPGGVSLLTGYVFKDATVGALTFLVVYVLLAARHPMRTRQLEHDEEAWRAHRHLDNPN